jgi:Putative small multi-drug export protein
MDFLFKLLTITAMGAVLIWAAVPAGLAMGLHPAIVAAATAIGSILAVLVVVLVGEPARAWLLKRLGPQLEQSLRSASHDPDSPRQEGAGLIVRVWKRYGFIGLALVAPLFPGPAGAAAIALALGIPGRRVFFWGCAGIILWTAGFTLAVTLGIAGVQKLAR